MPLSHELGTDGWIQNITGNILTPDQGKIPVRFLHVLCDGHPAFFR